MPWEPDELRALRKLSIRELFSKGKIDDKSFTKKNLFTCDRCDRVEDCEWAYHHDNVEGVCLWQELGLNLHDEEVEPI